MRTSVVILLVTLSTLPPGLARGADQSPAQLAPGETRSIFNQGALGRLKDLFDSAGGAAGETSTPSVRTSPARRTSTPRTASRMGRPGLLNRSRTTTAARRSPAVTETAATASQTPAAAPADTAATATEPTTNTDTQEAHDQSPAATVPTISLARQSATLGSVSLAETDTEENYQGVIRAAERPVTPREVATLASESRVERSTALVEATPTTTLADPPATTAEVPESSTTQQAASRLLAADDAGVIEPFEVGLSPTPRLIPQSPAVDEPAPALPETLVEAPRQMQTMTIVRNSSVPAAPRQPVIVPAVPRTTLPPQETVSAPPVEQIVEAPYVAPVPTRPVPAQPAPPQPVPPQSVVETQPTPQQSFDVRPAPAQPQSGQVVAQPATNNAGVLRRVETPRPAPPAVARLTATMIGPKEIYFGDTGIFKVHLVNDGDAPAREVRVEIMADNALMKTLNVGTVPAKTDVDVEIALSPNKIGSMELRAIATGGQGVKAVAGSVVFVGKPELSLAIAGPPQMNHGDLKLYTAILNNSGNADATNVTLLVMLQGEKAQSLPVGIVPAGQTRQVRFELRPEQAGQLAVNAVASADGNVQAVANGAINVLQHEVQLALEGPRQMRYGEKVVYTLVVNNRGNTDAADLVVNVTLGESVLERLYEGTLAAGKQEKISFEVSPAKPGFHAMRAVALGAGDMKAATSAKLQVQHGQLELTIDSPSVKFAGAQATYKVSVKNIGDANAEEVLVTAQLPESVKYLSGVDRIGFYEGVTWRIGQLTPGQVQTYELSCELSDPGEHKIVFNATGADQLEASQTVTTAVEALADVRLFVADPQGLIPVGQDVVYEIEVHNRGVKPAQNIEVVMQLSDSLEPIHVEGGDAQLQQRGVVFDPIAKLAAKETVKLRVTARAKTKGSHQYRVEMTAAEPNTFMASEGTTRFYGASPASEPTTATGEE